MIASRGSPGFPLDVLDLLELVCGRGDDPGWLARGLELGLCQRCAGIYLGAALGILAAALLRPGARPAVLALHAFGILQIAPAGLHLYPQGPLSRTVTGLLFGVSLAYFLGLEPLRRLAVAARRLRGGAAAPAAGRRGEFPAAYALFVGGAGGLLLATLQGWLDGAPGGWLRFAAFAGLAGVSVLAVANAWLALAGILRSLGRRRPVRPRPPRGSSPPRPPRGSSPPR